MLERPKTVTGLPQDDRKADKRLVTFRGAGFAPKSGRYAGWIALALVIALWQLAGSAERAGDEISAHTWRAIAGAAERIMAIGYEPGEIFGAPR